MYFTVPLSPSLLLKQGSDNGPSKMFHVPPKAFQPKNMHYAPSCEK